MLNISNYRIIAVGKIKKEWIQKGIEIYLERLPALKINEVKSSCKKKEAHAIQANLQKNESIITLNETGLQLTSINFANYLETLSGKRFAFIIGGSDGLDTSITSISLSNISLSKMTFTHEIARLILIEQIYRAQSILKGSPYHRK